MASLSVLNILLTIKERGSVSRTDLQHTTGLSWGTITNTTRDLLNRNLIREEGALTTKAGRKPVRLAINPTSHSLVGIDLGRKLARCIILNLAGETLWYEELTFSPEESPEAVLTKVADMAQRGLALPQVASRICMGVGVALPGAIDVKHGMLRFAPRMPGWKNVPVRQLLQGRLAPPVRIEHAPNCLALAERWFGEAGRAENVLCVNLRDGVGMGILINGEVYRGSQEMAGEFGHMTVDPNGPLCGCGDHGCVEAYCNTVAVAEHVKSQPEKMSESLKSIFAERLPTVSEIVAAARLGDEASKSTFERMGKYLGIGVANLVDLFNPDLIVLAGTLTEGREFFMPALDQQVEKRAWRHSNRQLLISQLGDPAMAMGACGMVLQGVFDQDVLSAPELMQA